MITGSTTEEKRHMEEKRKAGQPSSAGGCKDDRIRVSEICDKIGTGDGQSLVKHFKERRWNDICDRH